MPMIDVHAPAGLLPAPRHDELARRLAAALLAAEGVAGFSFGREEFAAPARAAADAGDAATAA